MPPPAETFATKTTTRLLDALHDHANEPAWEHIDQRFRPVIAGLARRLGVSDADADEVAQHTLSEFVRAYRTNRYDRAKGRLSSWILGIAHHHALRIGRERRRANADSPALDNAIDLACDESTLRDIWTDERDRAILAKALAMLRDQSGIDDRTLHAFELIALRGVPAAEAASQCAMSLDQAYVAKSRVTRRLREVVEQLTQAFEDDH